MDTQQARAVKRIRRRDSTIQLSDLAGPSWAGFYLGADDSLWSPQCRRGFSPGDLKAQFWQLQELATLRHQADQLKKELARADEALEKAEARAAWYRRQLALESRAGMMLAAILETTP